MYTDATEIVAWADAQLERRSYPVGEDTRKTRVQDGPLEGTYISKTGEFYQIRDITHGGPDLLIKGAEILSYNSDGYVECFMELLRKDLIPRHKLAVAS